MSVTYNSQFLFEDEPPMLNSELIEFDNHEMLEEQQEEMKQQTLDFGNGTVDEISNYYMRDTFSHPVYAQVDVADAYDFLRSLETESVDLIITSPPYWGQRGYTMEHNWDILNEWIADGHEKLEVPSYTWYREHNGTLGLEPYPEWYIAHLVEILDAAKRSLKPSGSMWINLGDTYFARWSSIRDKGRQGLGGDFRYRRKTPMGGYRQEKQLLLVPARFAFAMQEQRWILRNDLIWYKPNVPPRPENDRLRHAHEHFFHFVKRPKEGRAKYYYDMRYVEKAATDVITCNVQPGQDGHSATFPVALIKPRILSSCPPNGLVVDPFCGTGRSLAVAIQNGRNARGCDLVDLYAKAALKNIRIIKEDSNDE
jgi:site-specific DNA-methyltransferase (cytosine-N4-specific)